MANLSKYDLPVILLVELHSANKWRYVLHDLLDWIQHNFSIDNNFDQVNCSIWDQNIFCRNEKGKKFS